MEQSHVSALQLKHAGLERQIHEEMSRPLPDLAMIQALKKRKLRIKEELSHF
ncbi:YdcH family protein [Novosphingobium sp.]|uniref:YdcH family protein n=1 Tax=Novosphingobium sp. TaxID=1874826 RepID=UPI0035AED8A1